MFSPPPDPAPAMASLSQALWGYHLKAPELWCPLYSKVMGLHTASLETDSQRGSRDLECLLGSLATIGWLRGNRDIISMSYF